MITTCLTILNSLAVLYLIIIKDSKFYFSLDKETTFWNKTLFGYRIILWKKKHYGASSIYSFYIPVRNRRKTELAEEIHRLIQDSTQNRIQKLSAIFSWLKTIKQVEQFEKDYLVADRVLVEKLVADFKLKNIRPN